MTTSTPSSPQGRAFGSRSARTWIGPTVDHHDRSPSASTSPLEAAVGGVVAQEMGVGGGVGQVVDRHHLDIGTLGARRPQEFLPIARSR